jgi:hypothetical protein
MTLMNYEKGSALGHFSEVLGNGRFNRPRSFPVLYLARNNDACRSALRKLGLESESTSSSHVVIAMELRLSAVLDLGDPGIRRRLGLSMEDLKGAEDWSVTQAVGIAAQKAELDGILYPVQGRPGSRNVAVFLEQVTPGDLKPTVLDGAPDCRVI